MLCRIVCVKYVKVVESKDVEKYTIFAVFDFYILIFDNINSVI